MSLPITSYLDYEKGPYKCPFSTITLDDLNSYIESTEPDILKGLLGFNLSAALINDLTDGVPSEQRFVNLFSSICISFCGVEYHSEGIKDMIQGFVYWYYTRELETQTGMSGVQRTNEENKEKSSFLSGRAFRVYNYSVSSYLIIQEFIKQNIQDYPEFNGKPMDYLTILS